MATSTNANVPYTAVPNQVLVLASTKFTDESTEPKSWKKTAMIVGIVLLALLTGIPAAILSWRCNKALGYPTFSNVLYSTGAFMTGVYYIVYYIFFRSDLCKHCAAPQIVGGSKIRR